MKNPARIFALILVLCLLIPAFSVTAYAADTNLALGKPYEISSEAKIDNSYPNLANLVDDKSLTDGKKATASDLYTNWNRFYRGLSKSVVIDLGSEMYVNKISVGFLNATSAGICYPRTVKYAVSTDGENFSTVFEENNSLKASSINRERVACTFTSDGYYAARYVKIYFISDVYVYVDEIEVFGTETKPSSVLTATPDEPEIYPDEFGSNKKEIMDGATDIVLIYNGRYYKGQVDTIGNHSADNFMPYVGYLEKSGAYTDTMFDSYLFLPLAPGDGCDGEFTNQKGWEIYLENTIGAAENVNLTALDAAVAEMKKRLNLDENYKVNIFMTVPTVPNSSASFGTLDGTTAVKTNNLENAKKVVKWYVDLSTETFNKQNFQNLNLTGFYWYNELVRYTKVSYDEELIKYFTEYCHSLDHAAIWIPYFCAPGFAEANKLGFDAAALQSGYAFPKGEDSEVGNSKLGTCYDSMSMAKKYGLGVEMEISMVSDVVSRYSDYLTQSYFLGCMDNGVTMYYQSGGHGDFYRSATSTNSLTRTIYDMTYEYVKKTFAIDVPYMDYEGDIEVVVDLNNSRNRGNLPIVNVSSVNTGLKLADFVRPEHGELSLEANGFFFYTPDEGYTGPDSFTFSVTNGYYTSDVFTVKINVVDSAMYCNGVNSKLLSNRVIISKDVLQSNVGDEAAYEIAVDAAGNVISVGESSGIAVPEGGFVISASGDKIAWAKENVSVGQKVVYDPITTNIAFLSAEQGDGNSEAGVDSLEAESIPTVSEPEGSDLPVIPIVAAVAVVIVIAVVVVIIKKSKRSK